jgi:hypothetical protein
MEWEAVEVFVRAPLSVRLAFSVRVDAVVFPKLSDAIDVEPESVG